MAREGAGANDGSGGRVVMKMVGDGLREEKLWRVREEHIPNIVLFRLGEQVRSSVYSVSVLSLFGC